VLRSLRILRVLRPVLASRMAAKAKEPKEGAKEAAKEPKAKEPKAKEAAKETKEAAKGPKDKEPKDKEGAKPKAKVATKRASKEAGSGGKPKMNKAATDWSATVWGATTGLRISSWNVDGLRACATKGGAEFLTHEDPDVLCLQETKASESKLPEEFLHLASHPHAYWLAAEKEGYSGVGLLSKTEPLSVRFGFGTEVAGSAEHDSEGRLITAEFPAFFLVTAYVPNAGRGLPTLPKRLRWDPMFRQHLAELDKTKPVVVCGDLNVAHQEIDLKNPKTNKRNAGFTQEEREGMTELLELGLVDTFRHLHPEEQQFTFWTYMMGCRAKGVGWRLDYFLVSRRLLERVEECHVRGQVFGSDHCPITLMLQPPE